MARVCLGPWAGLAGAAALSALAILGPAAAGSEAQPPRKFYGVVSQTTLEAADYERMGRGRVGTLRAHMPWASIDRSPLARGLDWREFDFIVSNAARQGVRVLPMVYGTPHWLARLEGCDEQTRSCYIRAPRSQHGLSAWRGFLQEAARRYGPRGNFWLENPDLRRLPIRTWQIWNEQNAPYFFGPQPDPRRYADLVTAASHAIHDQDAGARVILGGMVAHPGGATGIKAHDFLRQLYEIVGFEQRFEGIAIHPYAFRTGRLGEVKRQVTRLLAVAEHARDPRARLWVTEIGWGSGGGGDPLNLDLAGQAQRLRQALRYLTRNRLRFRIPLVAWYAWRDTSQAGVCFFCAYTGLFEAGSLEPKPAWGEFLRFTGGR